MKYIRIIIDGLLVMLGGFVWIFMEYISSYNPGNDSGMWEDTVSFLFPYVKTVSVLIMALGAFLLILDVIRIKNALNDKYEIERDLMND